MPLEDKDIEEAKKILGELSKQFTDDELRSTLVEILYLTETWMDEYERKIFDGKTLNELLGGL